MDIISRKLANDMIYAYHNGRFWRWDDTRSAWKESHLMAQKFQRAKSAVATLTPEAFLTDGAQFTPLDDYEIDSTMAESLKGAKPCKTAPIDPVEDSDAPGAPAACICSICTCGGCKEECFGNCRGCGHPVQECNSYQTEGEKRLSSPSSVDIAEPFGNIPTAPNFDFGADDQTNALLLQDAQTFITGNMARIMAAKHAHDLTANHYKGSWGKWCAAVGISRDTGDRMVSVAAQCGNIEIDGKPILDVQPLKLLYAAAKPSTPQEVKQAVFSGDITTYKEYQDVMAQLKAKDAELAQTKANLDHEIANTDQLMEERGQLLSQCEAARTSRRDAEERTRQAENERDAALADVQGLHKDNARLNAEKEAAEARAKNAEEALKKQPITTVVDEEEVDRRAHQQAYGIAADMTDELRARNNQLSLENAALTKRLETAAASAEDTQKASDAFYSCLRSIDQIWDAAVPSLEQLRAIPLRDALEAVQDTISNFYRDMARVQAAAEEEER